MLFLNNEIVGNWVARRTDVVFNPNNSTSIGWLDKEGNLIAGVLYENYTKTSIMAHIAIDAPVGKKFFYTIHHYPFIQLGVLKVIGQVKSNNEEALRLDKKLGFIEEARLKDIYPDADLIFLTLSKENCKFLGERYGR